MVGSAAVGKVVASLSVGEVAAKLPAEEVVMLLLPPAMLVQAAAEARQPAHPIPRLRAVWESPQQLHLLNGLLKASQTIT